VHSSDHEQEQGKPEHAILCALGLPVRCPASLEAEQDCEIAHALARGILDPVTVLGRMMNATLLGTRGCCEPLAADLTLRVAPHPNTVKGMRALMQAMKCNGGSRKPNG